MRPPRSGGSGALTPPPPVENPQATVTKSRGTSYGTPNGYRFPASRTKTNHRRWRNRPPRTTIITDAIAWLVWLLIVVGTIAAMLAVLELAR